jgi:Tfp pilus assembly protein PilN
VMDDVSRALPELLWLDHLQMTSSSIEVDGRAFNTNAVANFIDNLDKVPEFAEPTLKSAEAQQGGVYKFVINLTYSFAGHGKPGTAGATPGTPTAAPKTKSPKAPVKPATTG